MAYSEKVINHFENPRNVGAFAPGEQNVGRAIVGAPSCGDVMQLEIKVDPENGKIVDAKFKTFGCLSAIASSSYTTELLKGKTLQEAQKITNSSIAEELKLPPVKIHCSVLAEEAVRKAVENFQASSNALPA